MRTQTLQQAYYALFDPEILNLEEVHRLVSLAQSGDNRARDRIILHHMRLIFSVAKSLTLPAGIEPRDLIADGIEGLCKAIDSFKVGTSTCSFCSFAVNSIRWEIMLSAFFDPLIRIPEGHKTLIYKMQRAILELNRAGQKVTDEVLLSILEISPKSLKMILREAQYLHPETINAELDETGDDYEGQKAPVCQGEVDDTSWIEADELEYLLSHLTESERKVICLKHGVGEYKLDGERTFKEVGRILNRSKETVRQRYNRAMNKMRRHI